jgi:hypothetical protein
MMPMPDDSNEIPTIGHNAGPALDVTISEIDPTKLALPTEVVRAVLEHNYPGLTERRDELLADIADWIDGHRPSPDAKLSIDSEDDLKLTKDLLDTLAAFPTKDCAPTHKAVKAVVLAAGREIDAYFNKELAGAVTTAAKAIRDVYDHKMVTRYRHQRAVLQDRAAQATLEAERLAAAAKQEQDRQKQAALEREAHEAREHASRASAEADNAKPADLSRLRTDLDRVGGVTVTWTYRVEQLHDTIQAVVQGQQPASRLRDNPDDINAAIAAGIRMIPGLHIYEVEKAR